MSSGRLVATTCPLCGGTGADLVIEVGDPFVAPEVLFPIGECKDCGLARTLALPPDAERGEWYARHYSAFHEQEARRSGALRRLWQRICAMHPHDILAIMPRGGRLLEIGCGEGAVLGPLARRGRETLGVEPDPRSAARARARGLQVVQASIEDFAPAEVRFDHVLFAFVLEHLADPLALLRRVRGWLTPQGRVHVFCPDYDSPFRHELGRDWQLWHVPYQRVFFTERTLLALLRESGLTPTRVRHYTRGGVLALGESHARGHRGLLPHTGRAHELVNRGRGLLAALRGRGDCLATVAK